MANLGFSLQLKSFKEISAQYHKRFAYHTDYSVWSEPNSSLRVLVVIPCFNENLEATMQSLGACSVDAEEVEILLVINHSTHADVAIKKKHEQQFVTWNLKKLRNGIPIYGIKAFDLEPKHAGVGLARKIGMDKALERFATINHDGLIVCLDGDCTVSPNYLDELIRSERSSVNGLSIRFEHPLDNVNRTLEQDQIILYELWLRYYILALRQSHYFNAFHTIGSSMAVRASAYAKIGGMNRRKAGEDFYFLHKLMPHDNFSHLSAATVYPSARTSDRVPFGTGRAMLEMKANTKSFKEVYNPQIFAELKHWLGEGVDRFETNINSWPVFISDFAKVNGWLKELEKLKERSKGEKALDKNFRFWLDGFKVLKLVHYAREHYYPDVELKAAYANLLNISAYSYFDLLAKVRVIDDQQDNINSEEYKK